LYCLKRVWSSDEETKGPVMPECRVESKMKKAGSSEAVDVVGLAFTKNCRLCRFCNCVLTMHSGRGWPIRSLPAGRFLLLSDWLNSNLLARASGIEIASANQSNRKHTYMEAR
jgi:hypothetical protein